MPTTFDSTTTQRRTAPPKANVAPLPQAASARARQRRRWVRRTFLLLLVSSVALIVLATWKRDNRVVALLKEQMQPAARELQATLDRTGALPAAAELPSVTHYLDHAERFYAQRAEHPVIVAYRPARYPEELYLKPDGRTVMILDQGRIHVEWLDENALRERLELQSERMRAFEKKLLEQPLDLP